VVCDVSDSDNNDRVVSIALRTEIECSSLRDNLSTRASLQVRRDFLDANSSNAELQLYLFEGGWGLWTSFH